MRASSFESSLPKLGLLAGLSFLGAALAPEAVMSRVAGQALPPTISLTAIVRDFKGVDEGGHPDFERNKAVKEGGNNKGAVAPAIGADGKPVFTGPTKGFTTAENFDQWYRDVPGVNLSTLITLTLPLQADGTYVYDDKDDPVYGNGGFFPIDGQVYGNSAANPSHNFHFTTELHARFTYDAAGGQMLRFLGDDDVWVFINGELVIDLGGTHSPMEQVVDMTGLGLVDDETYTMDLYHAERQTNGSNFRFQTNVELETTAITPTIVAFD